ADPSRVAGLTVELPAAGPIDDLPAGVRVRLDALLGPGGADLLGAAVRRAASVPVAVDGVAAGGWPLRPVPGGDAGLGAAAAPAPAVVLAGDGRGGGAGVAPALQRAALAHAAACEPGVPRLVRAVALLEAADALARVAHRLDLRSVARQDARVGAGLLVDLLAEGLLVVPSARVAGGLAAALRRTVGLLGGQPLLASRLAALAGELERGRHVGRPRPA